MCALLVAGCDRAAGAGATNALPRFPLPGSIAPLVSLPAFGHSAAPFALASERGHVVVFTYWASWCGPCTEEMPELSRLAAKYRDQGLRVYAVVHDDDPATAAAWMRAKGVTLPLLLDPDKHASRAYLVRGLPTAYVIDRTGKVWRRQEGYEGPGHWEPRLQAALIGKPSA